MDRRGVQDGMKVRSSDGTSLGKVVGCGEETFIIEKGFFFPKDYTARYDQVAELRDGEIWLREAGERLLKGAPIAGAVEEVRVPLSEEQIIAEKRMEKAGEVRIHKDVKVEERQVSVPVMKEEVHVERTPASAEPRAGEATFKEGTVSVPVYEEEVEIRKRPMVSEEVRVAKTAHEEERRATAEVRKETAEIEREGSIPTRGAPGSKEPGRS